MAECVNPLRPGGRVAYPNGVEPEPKKRPGIRVIPYDAVSGPAEFIDLTMAVEAAKLKVQIAATYTLGEAAMLTGLSSRATCSGKSCFESTEYALSEIRSRMQQPFLTRAASIDGAIVRERFFRETRLHY